MDIGFNMISFFFEDIDSFDIQPNIIAWLESLIVNEQKKPGTINYIICSDDYLLKVNQEYLDHDYYTDIITFDYVKGKIISGDIFVSLQRIQENSNQLKTNFNSEFQRVLAHGLLHLCGYKDKTEDEKILMRKKEDFYLNQYSN